jgi:predicted SAM-dependent methyltransferase
LVSLFEKAGFETRLLEYFDENGVFQRQAWNDADGFVKRSRYHDERNTADEIYYTSLIINAIKK